MSTPTPPEAETRPPEAETRPPEAETRPPEAETRPPEAETRPPEAETTLQTLARALEADTSRRSGRLRVLLDEACSLREWRALELPQSLRRYLARREQDLARDLLNLLLDFERVGGCVDLQPPDPDLASASRRPRPPPARVLQPPDKGGPPPGPTQLPAPAAAPAPSRGTLRPLYDPAVWQPALVRLLAGLLPSKDLDTERVRVLAATRSSTGWIRFPQQVQHRLVGLVAARLRTLQDDHGMVDDEMSAGFARLTAFSAEERPGFVFGLSRKHLPTTGSWSEDADRFWRKLWETVPIDFDATDSDALLKEVRRVVEELDQAPEIARAAVRAQAARTIRAALEGGIHPWKPELVELAGPVMESLEGRDFLLLRQALSQREGLESSDDD